MRNLKCYLSLLAISLVFLSKLALADPTPPANYMPNLAKTPVLMIIDASGSTADADNQIQTKDALAKQIFKNMAADRTQTMHFGITRYLFAKDHDCGITSIYAAGPNTPPAIMQHIISGLPPIIANPLPIAMNDAVNALAYNPIDAVVLIINTNPQCEVNPCEAAKEIKSQSHRKIATYIVAFQSSPRQQKNYECLAQATQGDYINAQNPKALTSALMKVLNPIQQGVDGYGSINLTAVSQETGNPIVQGVRWWAFLPDTAVGTRATVIQYSNQPNPHFELAPGTYTIQLTYGEAAVKQDVTIQGNQAQNLTLKITTAADYQVPQHGPAFPQPTNNGMIRPSKK